MESEPSITARIVTTPERKKMLSTLFSTRSEQVEQGIYRLMNQLSDDYQGGYWEYYLLSNGSFYMAPSLDNFLHIRWSGNGFEGTLSADAAGIIACLFTYSLLSFHGCNNCQDMYHTLLDYAELHPEASLIFQAID